MPQPAHSGVRGVGCGCGLRESYLHNAGLLARASYEFVRSADRLSPRNDSRAMSGARSGRGCSRLVSHAKQTKLPCVMW